MSEQTVYINDNPIGETDVYHDRPGHASRLAGWRDEHVREATPEEATAEGLRPCKVCNPPLPDGHLTIDGMAVDPQDLDWQTVTKKPVDVQASRIRNPFTVVTMEGTMTAEDAWLIKGVEGELYPVDPDIFAQTYIPDPTKVPQHTDEDVLQAVREIHAKAMQKADAFRAGMEAAADHIEDRLLDYDDVDVDLQGDHDG